MTLFSYIRIYIFLLCTIVGASAIAQSGITNYGNMHIHSEGNLAVHDRTDFTSNTSTLNGTERRPIIGSYIFAAGSTWQGASDDNHIDGYNIYLGDDAFIFPVGNNQSFRPFAKKGSATDIKGAYFQSNPSVAMTSNPVGGNYPILPATGPFDITQLASEIYTISSIEYWDIDGSDPTQITLTWNTNSAIVNLTVNSIDRLTIVGWRNGQWEEIDSEIDLLQLNTSNSNYSYGTTNSTLATGSITSSAFVLDNYEAITLGALRCKKNQIIAQQKLTDPSLCRRDDGSITWSGFDPLINYSIRYTFNNNSINTTEKSDANGNLQLPTLGAGDYFFVMIDDGICTRTVDNFTITDDLQLDSDMDGLTDCEEVDQGSPPFDPCLPNPLGNLDADCDGDNVKNRIDCAPIAVRALSRYDCDERILYLDVEHEREVWVTGAPTKYTWYDSDPDATPSVARIISEEQNPVFSDLEKGFYDFYATVDIIGCPIIGKSNVPVEVEDLSNVSDDTYTFDFTRDTVYILNLIGNDNITLNNNRLFIQDPPNDARVIANLDGTVTFIPRSGYSGEITFTYVVCNLDCIDECFDATVTIDIITPECAFIPSGFSPNGDGVNDVLEITCLEQYPGSSLTVYNRWGDEIYGSPDYRNDWDGTWNGKILPTGTYYYALKLNDQRGSKFYGYIYIQH